MDDLELEPDEKNFVGNLDKAVVNFGLVCFAIFPTLLFLIFRPKAMVPLLRGERAEGREGLKLGPGITFVLAVLLLLIIGMVLRDPAAAELAAEERGGAGGIRAALAEGNLWRSIILSLPLYFVALTLGLIVQTSHLIIRQKTDLRQAFGIGLYGLSTLMTLIIPIGMASERYGIEGGVGGTVIAIFFIAVGTLVPWQIFSFSKHSFGNPIWAAIVAAIISLLLVFVAFIGLGVIVSTFVISD